MDYLSNLAIDIFIKNITYLPFSDVISVCQSNKKLYNYCNDSRYNNHWKHLIDDTFRDINDYQNKIDQIRENLGLKNKSNKM